MKYGSLGLGLTITLPREYNVLYQASTQTHVGLVRAKNVKKKGET